MDSNPKKGFGLITSYNTLPTLVIIFRCVDADHQGVLRKLLVIKLYIRYHVNMIQKLTSFSKTHIIIIGNIIYIILRFTYLENVYPIIPSFLIFYLVMSNAELESMTCCCRARASAKFFKRYKTFTFEK